MLEKYKRGSIKDKIYAKALGKVKPLKQELAEDKKLDKVLEKVVTKIKK